MSGPRDHPFAKLKSISIADIATQPLVLLNRPVAAAYYQGLFDAHTSAIHIAAYANSTELVRSLVSTRHGSAVLNMQPHTQKTYCGENVVSLPISDPLPPLTLAIGYDKSHPRRMVQHFADACRAHFRQAGPHRCISEHHKERVS